MQSNGRARLLIGQKEILEYLQIGQPTFYEFVKLGLPARVIFNRWYAHKDNLEEWFKGYTRVRATDIPPEAE